MELFIREPRYYECPRELTPRYKEFLLKTWLYTPVRKVLEQKKVLWLCLGGNGSTRTILCQTCVVLGTVTDFRLTHRKYAKVIKAQSSHIKW